ncbi:MAG: Eco57I restriction-modification methylase domain-containing protein [Oscillospiraceae bacterium]
MNNIINEVVSKSGIYLASMPKEQRKEIGQFFTSPETAVFMASLFNNPNKNLRILDPGTGSGILSAAIVSKLQSENIDSIKLTCYETNSDVLPLLKENLEYLEKASLIPLEYEIIEENYITSQKSEFKENATTLKYDWVIGNPPYMKVSKDAEEAISMPEVCFGAPNLYFLFVSMSLFNLESSGEMVYIIPRSWTSGAYFRNFREYLFNNGNLEQVHLFVSRTKVFEQESVLQETMIIKVQKSAHQETIKITTSNSNRDFADIQTITMPFEIVVSGPEKYVYLVTTQDEENVLKYFKQFKDTLPSIGLKMKTGITVDFRCREYLRNTRDGDTVPLLYAQHIKGNRVVFPIGKEFEYITQERSGLLQRNKNYLFVKRFTTKEEKRRLQCGIYLKNTLPEYAFISSQNKINFIESTDRDLTEEEVYGLYVLFNSTMYDKYYRILNGSTQVNSTEINSVPVPPLDTIREMGQLLINRSDLSVELCDEILEMKTNE